MKTTVIANINQIDIIILDEEQLIPIKPICEALGVNYTTQLEKIKKHLIYKTTISLRGAVAADGKEREMICLPVKYIFGWLFTINPINVNPEKREKLIAYQEECNNALYQYFFNQKLLHKKQNEMERSLLEELSIYKAQRKETTKNIAKTKKKLEELRLNRLYNQLSFDLN